MKITEEYLIKGYVCTTLSGINMSVVNNKHVYWAYRSGLDDEFKNEICSHTEANEISLENGMTGTIELGSGWDIRPITVSDIIRGLSHDEN